jgi:hypothetical protein
MQHVPAREAIPRAEMIGAEDLHGGERGLQSPILAAAAESMCRYFSRPGS